MARIAMPLDSGYEDSEFRQPYDAFRRAGHDVVVLGIEPGQELKGKQGKDTVRVDATAADQNASDFDALVIPGGYSPDHLRINPDIVRFVRDFTESGKLIAAICHGPQLLIEVDAVRGKRMTSWPSVKTDLKNAGANWVDEPVVQDGNFITSRKPSDLDAFTKTILGSL